MPLTEIQQQPQPQYGTAVDTSESAALLEGGQGGQGGQADSSGACSRSGVAGLGPSQSTNLKSMLRVVFDTLNAKSVFITAMSVLSTLVCHRYGITLNISTDFIGLAVMFPIGIGINGAFNRREEALKSLAEIRGNSLSIRLAYSHWVADKPSSRVLAAHVEEKLRQLSFHIKAYLTPPVLDPALMAPVVSDITALSRAGEGLRLEGLQSPELAQLNERIRAICVQVENLKNIRIYRTPISMRGYSKFFILLFPVIFGPAFNNMSIDAGKSIWHGLVLAIVYSIILTGLDNVQDALENPFDGYGSDDIQFY
jgi:hypothetical protein